MPAYNVHDTFPWPLWQSHLEMLAVVRGLTADAIAEQISADSGRKVSRCAVIGRLDRTGVKLRRARVRAAS